jgi:ABC-type enterobactin transport system permease subunit
MNVKQFWASIIGGAAGSLIWISYNPHTAYWKVIIAAIVGGLALSTTLAIYYQAKKEDEEETRK